MFPVGTIVTPRIDAGIGTAQDRYTARVADVDGAKMRIEDARWTDCNGVTHSLTLRDGLGEWANPEGFLNISEVGRLS